MDFTLTDEQKMIAETARKVGEEFGLDYWRDKDAKKEYPTECWQAICNAGLAGANLPTEYGGGGLGMLELALIVENIAAAGAGATVGQIFMTNPIFGGVSISLYGSDEMKGDLLPKLCRGELNFCMALTEPDAGSNTLEITTFAAPDGEGWRLNGRKIWITCVPQSQKMLVIARTKKPDEVSRRTEGMSLFMIDTDRAGVSHAAIEKVGTNTLPSSNVYFDDVRIEPDEVIGTLNNALAELFDVLNTERIVTTAAMVGAGELALRLGVDYAKERKVFRGDPIGKYQGLQYPMAQAHAELECARVMNYKAATLCDSGQPYGTESNIGKLIAAQAGNKAIERAMQTMGGMGFAKESYLERLWRDARLFKFAPVSEEMILNYISTQVLGLPRGY